MFTDFRIRHLIQGFRRHDSPPPRPGSGTGIKRHPVEALYNDFVGSVESFGPSMMERGGVDTKAKLHCFNN
jgi:hypothetical protein